METQVCVIQVQSCVSRFRFLGCERQTRLILYKLARHTIVTQRQTEIKCSPDHAKVEYAVENSQPGLSKTTRFWIHSRERSEWPPAEWLDTFTRLRTPYEQLCAVVLALILGDRLEVIRFLTACLLDVTTAPSLKHRTVNERLV